MMDRARYLRANNYGAAAQQLAAREHKFTYKPADPERFYDMLMLSWPDDASHDRNWRTAYNIASQIDDVLAAGATSPISRLASATITPASRGSAATVALDRMNSPSDALAMFDRYARAGRSLQVQTKGYYWAGRAALASGKLQDANAYFQRAAAYPELFYGQLALERLGRSVAPPPAALPQYVDHARRSATPSMAAVWSRPSGCSGSRAARPSRPCSSGRSPNRSTTTPTATSPSNSARRSAVRTSRSGPRGWRG